MLRKSYTSDKYVRPIIVILAIIPMIIYGTSNNKVLLLISGLAFATTVFGVQFYRAYIGGEKKWAWYYFIALLGIYAYILISIIYKNH